MGRFFRVLPGQYYDVETGNHYNYFRDYDPRIGRYLKGDPTGFQGGLNRYGYVTGSPLRFSDSLGLANDCDGEQDCCKHRVTKKTFETSPNLGGTVMCCKGKKVSCVREILGDDPAKRILTDCVKAHEDRHHQDVDCTQNNVIEQANFRRDVDPNAGECAAYRVQMDCLKNSLLKCGGDGVCLEWVRLTIEKKIVGGNRDYKCGF